MKLRQGGGICDVDIKQASPGISGVRVTCPRVTVSPGSKFCCHATDNSRANTCVGVKILNAAGKIGILPQTSQTETACFKRHGG